MKHQRNTWLEVQTSLWLMRLASEQDQAPPVPADEEEETERDLTARLTAQEFAALVDADRGSR